MSTFKTRMSRRAKTHGRVVLASDDTNTDGLQRQTLKNIRTLHPFLCAIKLNFHLLLYLGQKEITKITDEAHAHGLQTIADIKLNDIGNTNHVATRRLWEMGFDAVIANPIMGLGSLRALVGSAKRRGRGVISLCHMSAPEARIAYDMEVRLAKKQRLYQLFLDWALESKADGIVVGATFPKVIGYCSKKTGRRLAIFSPGVGTQGGAPSDALASGSDYLIVGRTILCDPDPASAARKLSLQTLGKAGP